MKKLFPFKTAKKDLLHFESISVDSLESCKLYGGFKEYKPTIYEQGNESKIKIITTNLLTGTEGNL